MSTLDHVNGLAVTARKLGIPVYFTDGTHRAWVRWLSPRKQMTYNQWLEQCRKQAAARMAEAEPPRPKCDPDESEISRRICPPKNRCAGHCETCRPKKTPPGCPP